ncbi:MAG: hypothetical protein COA33_012955 [Fluviicola sp.]|nr:hypothetical protein [Fluviicola sp.]
MIHTFHIDDSNPRAKALLEFVRTLDFVKKETSTGIPEWQQELTLKRLQELDKDPSKAIDFDDMLNELEKKHGL